MALKIWLPFNGNINNQGISNISTSGTASFSTGGKIGQCLTSSAVLTVTDSSLSGLKNWSVCFWGYVVSASISANWTRLIQISDGGTNLRVEVCPSSYNNGIYCYSVHNNSGNKITNTSSSAPSGGFYDKWHHFCMTSDGSNICIYDNGSLRNILPYNGDGTITGTITIENNNIIKKNDFRVYDHCLSNKEIKEISKGLVVHLPLNNTGIGIPNMVDNSATFSEWSIGSGWTKVITDDGSTGYRFTRTGATANNWVRIIPTLKINANDYPNGITVSMDILTPNKANINQKCLGSLQQYDASNTRTGWYEPGWDLSTVVDNQWSRVKFFFSQAALLTNSQGLVYSYTNFSFQLVQNGDITIRKIKVEPGNGNTYYTLSNNDVNSSVEFDTSGYGYNATKVGTLSYVADAPRFACSLKFTSGNYIKFSEPQNMYHATYTFWVKFNSFTNYQIIHSSFNDPSNGDSPWLGAMTESSGLWAYFGGNSPNYTKAGDTNLVTGTWYHFCYTWNNGVAQWYLNGAKIGNSVTYTTRTYIPNTKNVCLGDSYTGTSWNGCPFNGQLSDFRLYSTVLSDDEIKNLYESSTSIANNGILLSSEFVEV